MPAMPRAVSTFRSVQLSRYSQGFSIAAASVNAFWLSQAIFDAVCSSGGLASAVSMRAFLPANSRFLRYGAPFAYDYRTNTDAEPFRTGRGEEQRAPRHASTYVHICTKAGRNNVFSTYDAQEIDALKSTTMAGISDIPIFRHFCHTTKIFANICLLNVYLITFSFSRFRAVPYRAK